MIMTMRKKLVLTSVAAVLIHSLFIFATSKSNSPVPVSKNVIAASTAKTVSTLSLYDSLSLGLSGLSRQAFDNAMTGYNFLLAAGKLKNKNVLTIGDFSHASNTKRLFVLDLQNKKVLFNTFVSHGRNSGREMATQFSNAPESFKSSLGFYLTGDTYMGKHGYSMRLFGQEKGINDNADSRAIVMHSAPYVSEEVAKTQGFVGRSLGCPALPENCYKQVIEAIKNGSCLFLYSTDKSYAANSAIIKKTV